jgi:hypothetical protein
MHKSLRTIVGFTIIVLSLQRASAWETGVDHDTPLQCEGLLMAGAEKIVVRITPTNGSMGEPRLVGIKEETVIWSHPFPKAGEYNVAKFMATCKGQAIQLSFQYPVDNAWISQRFKWDGKRLKWSRDLLIGKYVPIEK